MPAIATKPFTRGIPSALGADGAPQPHRSARAGIRVVLALAQLGLDQEHQVGVIASKAGLQQPHASRLLRAAVNEGLVRHGERYGTYVLPSEVLGIQVSTRSSTPHVHETVQHLALETGLAVAYHETGWRPGTGMYLALVDMVCPNLHLRDTVEQPHHDLRKSAAGRAAVTFNNGALACDALGEPLLLEPRLQESIRKNRVAASRGADTWALATPILRGDMAVATLTVTGPAGCFADQLTASDFAVLLRRAAVRMASAPAWSRRTADGGSRPGLPHTDAA